MLDGAHTKEPARALANTIEMAFPKSSLVLEISMANDKDHIGFAEELLSATSLGAVFFTEVSIAGKESRTTSASNLRVSWIQAFKEKGINILDYNMIENEIVRDPLLNQTERRVIIFSEGSILACIRAGGQILGAKSGCQSVVIVVTGSLHIVSAVLSSIER